MPASPAFPRVRSLRSALPLLRRPPAPAAVRFKPLTDFGERCQLAAYTDVRFVIDLLNAVCAQHWHAAYEELPQALRGTPRAAEDPAMLYVRCRLTVFDVCRADVGEGRDGTAHGGGPEGRALRRAQARRRALRGQPGAVCDADGVGAGGRDVDRQLRRHARVPDAVGACAGARADRRAAARPVRALAAGRVGAGVRGADRPRRGPRGRGLGGGGGGRAGAAGAPEPAPASGGNGVPEPGLRRSARRAPRRRGSGRARRCPPRPPQRAAVRQAAHQLGLNAEQLGVLAQLRVRREDPRPAVLGGARGPARAGVGRARGRASRRPSSPTRWPRRRPNRNASSRWRRCGAGWRRAAGRAAA